VEEVSQPNALSVISSAAGCLTFSNCHHEEAFRPTKDLLLKGRAFTRAVTWMLKRRNSIELSSRAQRGICCLPGVEKSRCLASLVMTILLRAGKL
jgi:hypothetical protein